MEIKEISDKQNTLISVSNPEWKQMIDLREDVQEVDYLVGKLNG